MMQHHARMQRTPFLTPIWLTVLVALGAFGFLCFAVWLWGTADATTVVVVRHAEKQPGAGGDPPLSAAGESRAALLSRMLGATQAGRVDAIYVSPALRSRMTASPLAARLGIAPIVVSATNSRELARRVVREHAGGRVLIVAHSDTVNDIVEALSGAQGLPAIGDDEYDIMYIVSVPRIGRANLLRLGY